jgi:glycosyltransferase involved in cell wall biosynthesis
MKKALTFVIPVRHQANARDWNKLKSNLAATVKSIAAQQSSDWKAIIVANRGADLPALPIGVEVKWVDFEPNPLHEQGGVDKETFYEAVRLDKGRRILAGMLHAGPMQHVMVVDDDDFISNKLAALAAAQPQANGWFIREGYVWGDGSNYVYRFVDFSKLCGTCYLIRADLYELPASFEEASDEYVKRMLGSHIFIRDFLEKSGKPLAPVPFVGAVYRVGHVGSHSKSTSVFKQYFPRWLVKRPLELLRRLRRLSFISPSMRSEYFGE